MTALTASRLREVLDYDQDTGLFRWRVGRGRAPAGAVAGTLGHNARCEIRVDGRRFMAHRLAWLYVHGAWPVSEIDHRNGDPSDNRIANLREATHAQNQHNQRRAHRDNRSSGRLGVSLDKRRQRFRASIKINNKQRHLGYFETAEDAHQAYLRAKSRLHPFSTIREDL